MQHKYLTFREYYVKIPLHKLRKESDFMKEYRFIEGSGSDIQKLLNQWKHKFHLTIIETRICKETADANTWVYVLLARTRREQEDK